MRFRTHLFYLVILLTTPPYSHADVRITSKSQLLRLPAYCQNMMSIRDLGSDPSLPSLEEFIRRYGQTFKHMHHYCWALNSEYEAEHMTDPAHRRSELGTALGGVDYVLERADPKFFLLPEMYLTRARILFKMDQSMDAVQWIEKSIALKPDNPPAYARLSDYYADQGNIEAAITTLKQGIARCKRVEMLTRRLKELEKHATK